MIVERTRLHPSWQAHGVQRSDGPVRSESSLGPLSQGVSVSHPNLFEGSVQTKAKKKKFFIFFFILVVSEIATVEVN